MLKLLLMVLMLLMLPLGCSYSQTVPELSVFAAAGAKPAIDEACHKFEEQHKVKVEVTYGGGGEVLSKMILAKSGDVYIAPEQRFVNFLTSAEGRAVFKKHGYIVDAEEVKKYWR